MEIWARLRGVVRLEAHASGAVIAFDEGQPIRLGMFSAASTGRLRELSTGLRLNSFGSENGGAGREVELLTRRLAGAGLLEYRAARPGEERDLAVIEPQLPGYWPQTSQLGDTNSLILSRFSFMRRRGEELVLESPRAGALFRIREPQIARLVAMLAKPRKIGELRQEAGFPGVDFFALLVDCRIALKLDLANERHPHAAEGDENLALWDFHDLLFHGRSTEGRHANPLGGVYPHESTISPLPAARPPWPGEKIDLRASLPGQEDRVTPFAQLLRKRHSTRSFNDREPITLAELSSFLEGTARVLGKPNSPAGIPPDDPAENRRPYPSAGASYELELYLAVNICEGLARGFYHYDPFAHALAGIDVPSNMLNDVLMRAAYAMDAPAPPQIVITIAARFGRVSWKYSSIAYSLVLKDAGILTQTFYLMAAEMGLGGCAIGIVNVDLFERMTRIAFHVEGSVGQFVLGRPAAM